MWYGFGRVDLPNRFRRQCLGQNARADNVAEPRMLLEVPELSFNTVHDKAREALPKLARCVQLFYGTPTCDRASMA